MPEPADANGMRKSIIYFTFFVGLLQILGRVSFPVLISSLALAVVLFLGVGVLVTGRANSA